MTKAEIHIVLHDDNTLKGTIEGTPIELGMMLHRCCETRSPTQVAILIAASAVLKDLGDTDTPKTIWTYIEDIIHAAQG